MTKFTASIFLYEAYCGWQSIFIDGVSRLTRAVEIWREHLPALKPT
jgi:hypothetical protein